MQSFEGAAAQPDHAVMMLKGLDEMARSADLPPVAQRAAARLATELRKASANGVDRVAIAEPEAESHEHIHFAVENLRRELKWISFM